MRRVFNASSGSALTVVSVDLVHFAELACNLATIGGLRKSLRKLNIERNLKMATAKKVATKAAVNSKTKTAAKVTKPVVKAAAKKAPVSKTAKTIAKISANIAKLTERKDKLGAEIKTLRDQRAALKVVAAPAAAPAPASTKVKPAAKSAVKAAAPVKKAAKRVAKK